MSGTLFPAGVSTLDKMRHLFGSSMLAPQIEGLAALLDELTAPPEPPLKAPEALQAHVIEDNEVILLEGTASSADVNVIKSTATGASTIHMRSADDMVMDRMGDGYRVVTEGDCWLVRFISVGTGTVTIEPGDNVEIIGANTVAANHWREFVLTVTDIGGEPIPAEEGAELPPDAEPELTPAKIVMETIGTGTYS